MATRTATTGTAGPPGIQGPPGPPGASSTSFTYTANTSTTSGYPGDGKLIWNNATQTSASILRISHRNTDGDDIDPILVGSLREGTRLIVQVPSDSEQSQTWVLTANTTAQNAGTATAYFDCPVTLESGTHSFANDDPVTIYLLATGIELSNATPLDIGTATPGTADKAAREGHVHAHGSQTDETHHAVAVANVSHGFLSSTDAANIPSSGEKAALSGTSGTPGVANQYVTTSDTRMSDARTPATHGNTHISSGSDPIPIAVPSGASGLLSGAWAALLNTATNLATVSTLALRDAAGRFRAVDPSDAADVATKGYVDGLIAAVVGTEIARVVYASNTSWSLATKTTVMSQAITVPASGRVRLRVRLAYTGSGANFSGLFTAEFVGVSGTDWEIGVHGHNNGLRDSREQTFDFSGLTPGAATMRLSVTPATGTLTVSAATVPRSTYLQLIAENW